MRKFLYSMEPSAEFAEEPSIPGAPDSRRILDLLPTPVWYLPVDRRYLYANDAYANLIGVEASRLTGRNATERVPSSTDPVAFMHDEQALQVPGLHVSREFMACLGHVREFEVTRQRVQEGDAVVGLVCCAYPIEGSKPQGLAIEQTVRRQLSRLGHELRTAVSGMVGLTAILAMADNLTSAQRTMLNSAQKCAGHLFELSSSMVDMADTGYGALRLTPTPSQIRPLLQEVCDWVRPRVDESQVVLQWQVGPAVPNSLRLDALRLRQVLLNLITNAARHTDRGFIAVRLEPALHEAGEHVLTVPAMTQRWRIEVEDSGNGMTQDDLATLFDVRRPRQLRASRDSGGAGLGLKICSEIVSAMGACLEVRSEPAKGTQFWFEFEAEPCGE